jgi:CRP-like cAMP-binding protein
MDGNLLVNIPLLAGLPPPELNELAALLRRRDFKAAEPIFWVGDAAADSYIIESGRVTLSCPDEHGRDIILGELGPGDFLGEICLVARRFSAAAFCLASHSASSRWRLASRTCWCKPSKILSSMSSSRCRFPSAQVERRPSRRQ